MRARDPRARMTKGAMLGLALLSALFLLVYGRAAGFAYVWDDIPTIQGNPAFDRPVLEGLRATQHSHLDATLVHLPGQRPAHESYRPLLFLSFAAEVAVFGRSARAMHIGNVLLGLLAVLLAFELARRLLRSPMLGLLVAALFALHPLQVEPICYVSARADLLAGLLALAGFSLALRGRGALAAAAFLGSLFTKEATVGLPLVVLAGAWLVRPHRRSLLRASPWLFAALPLYAGARALLVAGGPSSLASGQPVVAALRELPGFFLQYLSLFVAPRHLSTVRPLASLMLWGWVVATALLVAGLAAQRRGSLRGDVALGAFGLFAGAVFLAPAAVVGQLMGVAADRYAYLPVFGFALALVALGRHALRGHERAEVGRLVRALAIAAPLGCAWMSVGQAATWASPGTMYANAAAVEPDSSMAHYGVGLVLASEGKWAAAMPELRRATALDPTNSRARNNLAVAYLHLGMLDLAENTLLETLAREGAFNFRAWYNLAEVHRARGRWRASCDALRRALAINPGYTRAAADLQKCAELDR